MLQQEQHAPGRKRKKGDSWFKSNTLLYEEVCRKIYCMELCDMDLKAVWQQLVADEQFHAKLKRENINMLSLATIYNELYERRAAYESSVLRRALGSQSDPEPSM